MDFDPKKDYYKILDIPETATAEDAKKAFKKLAVKHHPDRGGDKAKFQEINEAFQTLGDEKKKIQYDSYRKGGFGGEGGFGGFGGGNGGFGGFQSGGFDFGGVDLGDIFGGMFGGGFGGREQENGRSFGGEDIKLSIDITFEESYLGVTKKIAYSRNIKIEGIDEKKCSTCHGSGRVVRKVQTPFGTMQSQTACPDCSGLGKSYSKNGKDIENPFEQTKETIDINIPEGINDGVYIKFTGKGNQGLVGQDGDLYIKINVKTSTQYERKGENLYVKTNVSVFDLVLGGECEIPHPQGKLKVKIPKGTQIGDMIKVSAKGFGKGGLFGKKGDLYIIPKLEIPKKLSKEEEKLWSELKKLK